LELFDENGLQTLMHNLIDYERHRACGLVEDADCDYQSWMKFKTILIKEYKERTHEISLYDRPLQEWIEQSGVNE